MKTTKLPTSTYMQNMRKKLSSRLKERLIEDLSILLHGGMTLHGALGILQAEAKNPRLKKILKDLHHHTSLGNPLHTILHRYTELFTPTMIQLIKNGETTDNLNSVINDLVEHMRKESELKAELRSSLTYPAFLLIMATLVFTGLFTFLVPQFELLYEELMNGLTLPFLTKAIIIIGKISLWAIPLTAALAILISYYILIRPKKQLWILKLPLIGDLIMKINLGHFSYHLAKLLKSGTPIIPAIKLAEDAVRFKPIKYAIKKMQPMIYQGYPISESLRKQNIFPQSYIEMIKMAELAGGIAQTLDLTATHYFNETHLVLKRLTKLLEPLLITIIALIIGILLAGLFLPLSEMIMNMKTF